MWRFLAACWSSDAASSDRFERVWEGSIPFLGTKIPLFSAAVDPISALQEIAGVIPGDLEGHRKLDSDEVEHLVRPERLTEAELLELLGHIADVFYEQFEDALNADGRPASLEADLVRRLARFLDKFKLVPRPDFADTVTPGVMYESSEPRYRDRPLLAFSGSAEGRADGVLWSFWLSTRLAPDLNALVGESLGIASAARFTNPARD
jgi:hypothetical protein